MGVRNSASLYYGHLATCNIVLKGGQRIWQVGGQRVEKSIGKTKLMNAEILSGMIPSFINTSFPLTLFVEADIAKKSSNP